MMVCTKSLCLSFLVVLVCFLALPRLADEEPINSRSSGKDSSYNEDSHVVLTNPLQAAGVVSPFLGSKSQAVADEKNEEEQKEKEEQHKEQHPLPVLTQHPILMQPSLADFKEVAVGMPQIKAITINNPSPSRTLQLTSVSGDTPDFHPSFFQSKVVRPGESTTFDIVFLPRRVGRVGTILYIHTSLGTFKYEVYGTGVTNPYRLRGFLGIKIPVNATYSPIVSMYNPYSTSLQVTEIYSSGGDLHLELLTGQPEGTKSLWEIRPYETKPIIKLNFFGRSINNHTAFIRIKTNSSLEDSPIALPVEVKVTPATGIFLSREFIDFGLLKSGDEAKSVPLFLLNAGPGSVHVSSISTVPPNEAVQIQYTPTTLRQGSKYVRIASIYYHVDKVKDYSQHQGKIVVVFEDPSMDILEIPYEATVMQGTMTYEKTQTLFKVGKPPFKPVVRNMSLANQFQSPITLYDVRLPTKALDHFTVNLSKTPFILYPNSGWQKPFSVKFTPLSSDCQFSTSLRLHTNSSYFTIPLHCYDGKLKYEVQDIDKDSLEYGLMRYTDTISKRFIVININPVKISVTDYRVKSVDHASVELVHVRPSDGLQTVSSDGGRNYTEYKPLRTPFTIDVGHEAVFEVNVTKPNVKGRQEGEILIKTSLGKELHVPIFYKVVLGTLQVEPEVVVLKYGHPFTEVSANFSAWSFFDQSVKVISVQPDPPNPQFYYLPPHSGMPLLESEKMTEMGSVVFNPSKGEQSSQIPYLGLDQEDGRSSTSSWLYSLNGISNQRVAETDVRDYRLMRGLWNKAKTKKVKGSLILETDTSSSYEINVEASLHWPSLLPNTTISFPTTLVGNTSVKHVSVRNPSDQPLLVQALTLAVYPSPDSILRLLKTQFNFNTSVFDTTDLTTFYLPDSEAFEDAVPSDLSQEHHRDITMVAHSPLTVTSMIPPLSSAVVRVAFSPKVESNFTSLLLLRNNLTILDALIVHGYGAAVQLLFGGKEPGGSSALLFEYTEALLIQCHKELAAANSLQLVKTFTMRNTGQLPVHVLSMDFAGYGCSNYGFVVENCSNDFILEPNATKDVRVSFTPDFTMSRIQQTLVLHMTHGTELAFMLLATLPHSFLPICYAALPRLDIEKLLSRITAVFMVLLLVVVIGMALYSARYSNICQYYELDILHHNSSVFDLNNLNEDGYSNSGMLTGNQAETICPGKTNCTREGTSTVPQCSQASSAVTNCQEPSFSTSAKLKTPLEDTAVNSSQKALENLVHSSSQSSTDNGNIQLERRKRNNSQTIEENDNHNVKHSSELGNTGVQTTPRATKPVAAVTGTSRNSPGKSANKLDSCNDGATLSASVVAVTDVASQTPPLATGSPQSGLPATESTAVVDTPSYPKRKISRKQSNKALRHLNTESNTTKKPDNDKKAETKPTQEKTRPEKEVAIEKEDTHEQVAVKEKARDKVKPFTKDAGTGQAIPVEDAPHEGGLDAEDDLDDVGKKDLSARCKDKKKRPRVPPKKEEKEKRKKDRELEMMVFIKSKRLSSESIEVESTTSTENMDDENQSGDSDEKLVKSNTNIITDNKEDAKSSRPNDSPTGQSAPPEEEASKEQPAVEPQTNDNQAKRNEKKTLQLTEILSDPFSRKPDKTSYNSKKIVSTSKKQSAERTKSASSEEPDDSKPPTPVGGAKIRVKSKQPDGEVAAKAEEQATKSPAESKAGDSVRVTTPHEIAASLLIKNPAITTRSKIKVERETKEPSSKCEVHPTTKSPPLGKTNEMLTVEGYPFMPGNLPHHHHPRYLDMRADYNRQDPGGALSLHAEPFVPTVMSKDHFYDDPRQMNRMEVSRLQTGKTLGDYMPSSVTQASRQHYTKKHQENIFGDKPMFEDPRTAVRHGNMMPPVQQKSSPTMPDESPMYHPANYHSERMSHDPHFNYRYSNPEPHPEAYFEEDYSGLQSFDQQLVSRNARPNNLQYSLPEDGVSFHSSGMSGSHNIISASGRKGMNMMQGGGLTLTSPTSMFESPKKQQPPSTPNYPRPPGNPMLGGSDEGFHHTRMSRQHYMQQLQSHHHQQQLKASKQLHRMPPPGLGEPHMGEMMRDRGSGGGAPWGGAADELVNDPMNLQMQQQHHLREQQRRQHYLLQQQHQHFEMDDYSEMLPSLHTSAASPVFSPPSLNLAPGSGFSSSVYEPKSSPLDLGWDNSKNRDNLQSDVHWGSNSSSANNSSAVSMLWGGQLPFGSTSKQSLNTSQEESNSSEPPKFTGNIYGLFDGSGSIWDPAASSSNSSLLPWATQSSSEHKDNTPN